MRSCPGFVALGRADRQRRSVSQHEQQRTAPHADCANSQRLAAPGAADDGMTGDSNDQDPDGKSRKMQAADGIGDLKLIFQKQVGYWLSTMSPRR